MSSDEKFQGASDGEQILEAARRNNLDLFTTVEDQYKDKSEQFIKLLNSSRDAIGDSVLHLCCKYGCYEVMNEIIDLAGVDLNPKNAHTGDTPLHYAANYSFQEPDYALFLIQQLIEVGADPTIKNNEGLRPVDIIGDSNKKIKMAFESAQYAQNALPAEEIVDDDDDDDDES